MSERNIDNVSLVVLMTFSSKELTTRNVTAAPNPPEENIAARSAVIGERRERQVEPPPTQWWQKTDTGKPNAQQPPAEQNPVERVTFFLFCCMLICETKEFDLRQGKIR